MNADGPLRTFFDTISRGNAAPALRSREWYYGISDGTVSGKTPLHLWGRRTGLSATFPHVVASGTSGSPYFEVDQTLKLKSSSANDDGAPAGTGAQTVRVWWLDSTNAESTVDVEMNGTTIVATAVATMRRVNRMQVLTAGASGPNVGSISAYGTDGVTILLQIPVYDSLGTGISSAARRTVPAGYRDFIVRATVPSADLTNVVNYFLRYRTSPTAPWIMAAEIPEYYAGGGTRGVYFETPLTFNAGTDYEVVCSGNSSEFQVSLAGWTETT